MPEIDSGFCRWVRRDVLIALVLVVTGTANGQVDKHEFLNNYQRANRSMREFYLNSLELRENCAPPGSEPVDQKVQALDGRFRREVGGGPIEVLNPDGLSFSASIKDGEVELEDVVRCGPARNRLLRNSTLGAPFFFISVFVEKYMKADSVQIERVDTSEDTTTVEFVDKLDDVDRRGTIEFLKPHMAISQFRFVDDDGSDQPKSMSVIVSYEGELSGFPLVHHFAMTVTRAGEVLWTDTRDVVKIQRTTATAEDFDAESLGLPGARSGSTTRSLFWLAVAVASVAAVGAYFLTRSSRS